jgi:hypothetical protein
MNINFIFFGSEALENVDILGNISELYKIKGDVI